MKTKSVFYSAAKIDNAVRNCDRYPWAKEIRDNTVADAAPFLAMSDEELWNLIYSCHLPRSWMVLSYGHCPSCGESVPMYDWIIDPVKHPWKLSCPHCNELFPKNDFYAYYQSGLTRAGEFSYDLADDSLLYNTEHPDETDPLHLFGVDDGNGFQSANEAHPHLFIATYLVYGQWYQRIMPAIRTMSKAYTLTKNKEYAHKTAVLLDRLADFFPTYDWLDQGWLYEKRPATYGYVTYCINSAGDCSDLALAYDMIFDAICDDAGLVAFLSEKAEKTGYANKKETFADIQLNIEYRILRDVMANGLDKMKCASNFPHGHLCEFTQRAVLDWPENKDDLLKRIDEVLDRCTAVDGVSGEKGAGYSGSAPGGVAALLHRFSMTDDNFLAEMLARRPILKKTFSFHIDIWCDQAFIPAVGDAAGYLPNGDTENYCTRYPKFHGLGWLGDAEARRTWLWRMYKVTGDVRYVQAQYSLLPQPVKTFVPCSVYDADPGAAEQEFMEVIEKNGTKIRQESINFPDWHLGILRGGSPDNLHTAFVTYDSGGGHGHKSGMHLGLFAKGLDVLTDFGYPPVHCGGGWTAPYMDWHRGTASHNTVVVDGKDLKHDPHYFVKVHGNTTLWENGKLVCAMRFAGEDMIDGPQYERGVYMVELGNDDFYLFDVFRVVGGKEHLKFQHTTPGTAVAAGLPDGMADLNTFHGFMCNYRGGKADAGWSVDWRIRDIATRPMAETDVQVRMTDLTADAEGYLADGWYVPTGKSTEHDYLKRAVTRRVSENEPLVSNFTDIIEVYEGERLLHNIRRLSLDGGTVQDCAVEVTRKDGGKDLLISVDCADVLSLRTESTVFVPDWNVRFDGDFCLVRKNADGIVTNLVLAGKKFLSVDDRVIDTTAGFTELTLR